MSIKPISATGTDLCGMEVQPGLVDIHIHGCVGFDVTDNPDKLQEMSHYLAKRGYYYLVSYNVLPIRILQF